jgi:hypothetical protein
MSQKAIADINGIRSFIQLTDTFVALARQNTATSSATATPPNAAPNVISNASASHPNAVPTGISNTTPPIADPSTVTANQPALLSLSNTSFYSSVPINTMQNLNTSASASNNNSSWTFSAAMVASNMQQTILHAIPAQLLRMFQHRVYVPLPFFLGKNMERIRLERGIKSFKSLTKPICVIDACNFIDEKKLTFTQFNQAYLNFLKCLDLCCEPGSGIVEGWKDHFEHTVRDPNMEDKFKVYLYMDILMCQPLMVQPFIPDMLSNEYSECYAKAHRDITDKHTAELINSRIAASKPCGSKDSHISMNCDAKHIQNHPDHKTNVSVRDRHLVYNSDRGAVCIKFNLQGACNTDPTRQPPHRCSLCLVSYHGAAQYYRI